VNRPGGIAGWIEERIAAGDFPGAAWVVAAADRVLDEGARGHAVLEPERIAAHTGTLFDLASLTKPLCTASILLAWHEQGSVGIEDPVGRHLPAWAAAPDRAGVTILDLLVHRSGLPAWAPVYLHAADRAARIAWLSRVPLQQPPRARVAYSDLGYLLLGFLIEKVAGTSLDRLFADRVARPLGADVLFLPPAGRRRGIAATERGNARERRMAGPDGDRYTGWPTALAWGQVHDLNARTQGGVAGHAGLFGAAAGVLAIARAILDDRSGLIGPATRELLFRNLTAGLGEDRSAGFQIATTPGSSAGPALSPRSIGHTGFTGTSLWIDPEARRIAILLTNRVHPSFRDLDMNRLRREFHALAAAL
jgi:CubicO group peptidase (beta-lactamase class C family)